MYLNYDSSNFKISIPETIFSNDECIINFNVLGKIGCNDISFKIHKCIFEDQSQNKFEADTNNISIGKLKFNSRQPISLSISRKEIKFGTLNAKLNIWIQDYTKKQTILAYYHAGSNKRWYFDGIEIQEFNNNDIEQSLINIKNLKISNNEVKIQEKSTDKVNFKKNECSFIEGYKNSLSKEINFLRENGGRKYKVTNGKLVSYKIGEYAYVFELETELYIVDASPVKIEAGLTKIDGEVLFCEDFNITIILKVNIGEHVAVAYITVEPWKLLLALRNKMEAYEKGNYKIASMLINDGPNFNINKDINNIIKGQDEAINFAKNNPITIIWGPPGTGKTYTMSKLALDFLSQGKKVLILSHSNVSVDGVIKKIIERLKEQNKENIIKEGIILRYGYVRDEELSKNQNATSFNYAVQKIPGFIEKKEILETEIKKLKKVELFHSARGIEAEKELQKLRGQVREVEKRAVLNAKIIATTISKATVDTIFENVFYDIVMFDEASMAYVPQIFAASCMAREHFICVGDFFQLPPIVQSKNNTLLGEDIFLYLKICDKFGKIKYHPWLVMLDVQRRMHPNIAEYSNKFIYLKLLKNDEGSVEKVKLITEKSPFKDEPLVLMDLRGTYCASSKTNDNSRYNILSAIIAFHTAIDTEKNSNIKVGIITPYAAQMRIIRALIIDYKRYNTTNIVCSTIHQFQGSESDVIILDAVESYPSLNPGWLMTKNDNNNVTRLINVAVTRAKGKLIVIADTRFWFKKLEGTQNAFYLLLKFLSSNGSVIEKEQLKEYLEYNKVVTFYTDQDSYLMKLAKDFSKAKEKIVISIPDSNFNNDESNIILKLLEKARKKGVSILVKSCDFISLSDGWKKITQGSDDTIFPLIIIDGKIMWYGLPKSDVGFTDKNTRFITLYHMSVRIKGETAADIINSFAEMEQVVVGNNRRQLIEKATNGNRNNISAFSLKEYIEENYKCPDCNSKLTLKKGKSGKNYLGCISCKHFSFLTVDMVNEYLTRYNIKCSDHKTDLEARLGKYRVYVLCRGGLERHFINPSEL